MSEETRALVERAVQGDRAAVDALLAENLPRLQAFVRLRIGPALRGKESASDLAQSVCRELLTHLDRFQYAGEGAFRYWLYSTALRKIRNRLEFWDAEKRQPGREVAIEKLEGSGAEGILDCYRRFSSPSRRLMTEEALQRIEQVFLRLPDDYREVIVLSRLVGLSSKEIAEQMGRTDEAVRSLISRGLATLARLLEQDADDAIR